MMIRSVTPIGEVIDREQAIAECQCALGLLMALRRDIVPVTVEVAQQAGQGR